MNLDRIMHDIVKSIPGFEEKMFELLPKISVALIILLIGILIAFLSRIILRRVIINIGRFVPNRRIRSYLEPERMKEAARIISTIFFWIIIILFLTMATGTIGFPVLSVWLAGVVNYMPKIMIAVLIIVFGYIGASLVQNLMESAAHSAGIEQAVFIGKFGRYLIWLLTLLIGVDQLGIEISAIIQIILLVLAAVLLGAALSFGMGAKNFVSDILATHYVQRIYRIGDQIKIGEISGKIMQFTPLAVLVDTDEGQVYIPSKKFNEQISILTGKAN
jgi:small-conductance mechanosensitive channel